MKLLKIVNTCNQIEINSFYKVLNEIISQLEEHEKIELEKKTDAEHFVKAFNQPTINLLYKKRLQSALNNNLMLDLITDIFIKDGNSIMSRDWFNELFQQEIKELKSSISDFRKLFNDEDNPSDINSHRLRDYKTFKSCVQTAYSNDLNSGANEKITLDELSILQTLKSSLGLSNEEARGIYYLIIGEKELEHLDIDKIITMARDECTLFHIRKQNTIFIPDEFLSILREIKGISLPDKFTRRILKALPDKQINMIKKNHGIKETERHFKIEAIVKQGINIYDILTEEVFSVDDKIPARMEFLKNLIENKLEIHLSSIGRTMDDRISNLIEYFNEQDNESNLGIARDGYEKMIKDLIAFNSEVDLLIRKEFQIQKNVELTAENMLDYSIRPRDILYLLPETLLVEFCSKMSLSHRGKNKVTVILGNYKDEKNLHLENYILIANNDIDGLKNQGIGNINVGIEFENVTRAIFTSLGFTVNEALRGEINSNKDKADIILDLGDNKIIIIECKSSKESYSKFSTVTRQMASYYKHYEKAGYTVEKCLLASGRFSEDMKQECEFFSEFDLTLIEAETLLNIHDEFKGMNRGDFPYRLFKPGVLSENVTVQALKR
jgi:hypothetical protein